MPHKRETQMVCNLHFPKGMTSEFRIGRENFTMRFPGRMKNLLLGREPTHPSFITSKESHTLPVRPEEGGCLFTKQGVPHPTCSARGRRMSIHQARSPTPYLFGQREADVYSPSKESHTLPVRPDGGGCLFTTC